MEYDTEDKLIYDAFLNLIQSDNPAEKPTPGSQGGANLIPPKIVPLDIVNPDIVKEPEELSENMRFNIEQLQNDTNFFKYPIDKLALGIELPYPDYKVNTANQYPIVDHNTKKKKITIVKSAKAALLTAELLFNSLKKNEKFEDPEFGPTEADPIGRMSIYATGEAPNSSKKLVKI